MNTTEINAPLTTVEKRKKRKKRLLCLVSLLLIVFGLYYFIGVRSYVIEYDDEVENFKYGSIGSEGVNGLPYWVFQAMPHLFQDKLGPNGYASFGFIYEDGQDIPTGFSKRVVQGVDRVWLNCAGCHVGTYEDPNGEIQQVVGGSANRMRLLDFIQFFREAAIDTRLTGDNLVKSVNAVGGDLNFFEELVYKYVIFGAVKKGLLALRDQLAFLDRDDLEDWGPGRVDTFGPYKAIQFGFPMDKEHLSVQALNGSTDYPSLWMQRPREGMNLHWDGNNNSVAERNLSAALGAGVTPITVDIKRLGRLREWMWDFPAPKYPLMDSLDQGLLEKGKPLYAEYCAECHGDMGTGRYPDQYNYDSNHYSRLGRVEHIDDIGTDTGRLDSYTENFAAAQNMLYAGYPWRFTHFKKTNGYANHPLDGIWAASPYLHNGSVPTLRDLLEPSYRRPKVFYRGSNQFDWKKVGYESYVEHAKGDHPVAPEGDLFLFDTSKFGNGNKGHEGKEYGTYLSAEEKDAIVEYMKTF